MAFVTMFSSTSLIFILSSHNSVIFIYYSRHFTHKKLTEGTWKLLKERAAVSKINTKNLALISIFSAIWIVSQIYLGPLIGQITRQHGVINRVVGWLLMVVLAELTGRFGRVSLMSAIAALATRIVRRSASLYALTVGLGYALGGLVFDILYFLPFANNFEGRRRKIYILVCSVLSGIIAIVPYLVFKFYMLGLHGFLALSPVYAYYLIKGISLSFFGSLIGLSLTPKIEVWKANVGT